MRCFIDTVYISHTTNLKSPSCLLATLNKINHNSNFLQITRSRTKYFGITQVPAHSQIIVNIACVSLSSSYLFRGLFSDSFSASPISECVSPVTLTVRNRRRCRKFHFHFSVIYIADKNGYLSHSHAC